MRKLMVWKDKQGYTNRLFITDTTYNKLMDMQGWYKQNNNHEYFGINPYVISWKILVITIK
jgi:hypothetical protein